MWKYAAFHCSTATKKNNRSLFIWTFKWHIHSFNLHVKVGGWEKWCGVTALSSSTPVAPSPLPLKYDPPPPWRTPTHTPSPFGQPKSTGQVCFIRNDKCCTLAVPLPTSHLSWLETFYSCQLFHLTLTQTARKSSWWGERERALSV